MTINVDETPDGDWVVAPQSPELGVHHAARTFSTKSEAVEHAENIAHAGESVRVRGRTRGRRDPGAKFDADFLDAATQDPQEIERRGGFGLEDDL